MSTMTPRDLNTWAKEEIAEAVKARIKEILEKPDTDADDIHALEKQRDRVLKFLGF